MKNNIGKSYTHKNNGRRLVITAVVASIALSSTIGFAKDAPKNYDLLAVYKIAEKDNASYLAADATFQANYENIPIALGALLPNVQLQAGLQYNAAISPKPTTGKEHYFSANPNPLITIGQTLFDWGLWKTYSQSQYQFKADALILAQNRQSLILNTATTYFNILQAQDQLKSAKASVGWNKQLLEQTEQKFKVGISANTDVQSSKAQYENAVAQYVVTENTLKNAYNNLYQITGTRIDSIDELKNSFPFKKPSPNNAEDWVNTALKSNLVLSQAKFTAEASKEGVDVAWGAFMPSLSLSATANRTLNYQTINTVGATTATAGINASWNVLNGGSDYATVKQAKYTYQASKHTLKQTERNTVSSTNQSFLNVVTDISQVNALKQSVLANETSVEAMKAGYDVGTQTIVDLLNRQQQLFTAQQQYAQAKYSYITDLLTLRQQADINQWLDHAKHSTSNTSSI